MSPGTMLPGPAARLTPPGGDTQNPDDRDSEASPPILHSTPPLPTEMTNSAPADPSNGYEAIAGDFMSIRSDSATGADTVRAWARALPRGGAVLDLGCGHGVPISKTLIEAGLSVHGIDASSRLISAFRARFPDATAACTTVEDMELPGGSFDGAVAWGLMFLLAPETQAMLIRKVAATLKPGGRFLFTAPRQACAWRDSLTGQTSVSLGAGAYRELLEAEGFVLAGETEDEGQNHYYFATLPDREDDKPTIITVPDAVQAS